MNKFTKKMKCLYTDKYKTLLKEIQKQLDTWKDIPYSWIGRQYCENSSTT